MTGSWDYTLVISQPTLIVSPLVLPNANAWDGILDANERKRWHGSFLLFRYRMACCRKA